MEDLKLRTEIPESMKSGKKQKQTFREILHSEKVDYIKFYTHRGDI